MGLKNEALKILLYVLLWMIFSDVFQIIFGVQWAFFAYFCVTIFFSFVNIPIYRTRNEDDIVGINVGGCLLPLLLAVYLLFRIRNVLEANISVMVITAIIVIIVARKYSYYVRGKGVVSYGIAVPLASTFAVYLLIVAMGIESSAINVKLSIGYILSTMAVIVGTDLCHMHNIGKDGIYESNMSMGGAGINDGVWLSGMLTMMIIFIIDHFRI